MNHDCPDPLAEERLVLDLVVPEPEPADVAGPLVDRFHAGVYHLTRSVHAVAVWALNDVFLRGRAERVGIRALGLLVFLPFIFGSLIDEWR